MKPGLPKKILFTLVGSAIPSLVLFSLPYFGDSELLSLFNSPFLIFIIPAFLVGCVALLCCLICLMGSRIPVTPLLILIVCVTIFGCAQLWDIPIQHATRARFRECAERSKPLIHAINAYEAKHTKPPAKLEDLVPEFMPKIPDTGLQASPNYRYRTRDELGYMHEGEPWVLEIDVSTFIFDSTILTYLPDQNYSRKGTLWIERYGDWALISWITG
jgi:hypothetical protein